ncbi:MAG TPA: TIGR02996 domain-containing protein [Gemmataceae bacterium]|nr:TIGR02996 domain-containing protein [Gemmataceae bacterium]
MTDREALLRAIAANPDDDTPRLIYADCVEETGRPEDVARARFIRLQLDTYRGPGDTGGTDAFNRKLAEARALATPFVQAWLGELPDWAAKFLRQHERITVDDFRRGFLALVRVAPEQFARRGHELLDRAPIRGLRTWLKTSQSGEQFLSSSQLARVKSLAISGRELGDLAAALIASSPHLGQLEELDLSTGWITDHGAGVLARATSLTRLRVLRLQRNRVFTEGVVALCTSPNLPKLREIDLCGCALLPIWGNRLQERFPNTRILI